MKKIILSLLSLFTSTIVQAVVWINATNFPDATFREYVSWNYDKDFNKDYTIPSIYCILFADYYMIKRKIYSLRGKKRCERTPYIV